MSNDEKYQSPAPERPPLAQLAEERYARFHPEDPAIDPTVRANAIGKTAAKRVAKRTASPESTSTAPSSTPTTEN